MAEPRKITAGNSYSWTVSSSDYPASDGWVVSYSLSNTNEQFDITSVANGDDHDATILSASSQKYVAGVYDLVGFAVLSGERKIFYSQPCEIKPDPASMNDHRSYAKRIVDAIEATIEGKASADAQSLAINGKTLTRYPIADLLVFRDRFKREVATEDAARKLAGSNNSGGIVRVRFN